LRRIPKDARLTYEYSPTSHGMFPVGLLAHEAADRIAALEQSDAEQGEELGMGVPANAVADALLAVVSAVRDYLPPDGINQHECLNRVIGATDNPTINPFIAEIENGRS
jgi:hypothetical protein